MRSTVTAIEDQLTDERGPVYRYRHDDGLSGDEGSFLLCTFPQAFSHVGLVNAAWAIAEAEHHG